MACAAPSYPPAPPAAMSGPPGPAAPSGSKPLVYRLSNLPSHVDRLLAMELLASTFGGVIQPADIQIHSLAAAASPWERPPTRVATLTFRPGRTPEVLLRGQPHMREWAVRVAGLPKPLVLDVHFLGMTPLNDVAVGEHKFDCIVISGLGSHPLGSWQPKSKPNSDDSDRTFMWIRDALPPSLPGVRFLLYGYDTALANSTSFQLIVDLSRTLITHLDAAGWTSPTARPLLFLAHSLGGVVLKQAFVMLAGARDRAAFMLGRCKGAIFYGVPSEGMEVDRLLGMVEGQPNRTLVQDLASGSEYLRGLEEQFRGISYVRRMVMFWAYETRESPGVVQLSDGSWARSGPTYTMVTPQSATGGRWVAEPTVTIPIDEDHSGMVKFSAGDFRIPIMTDRIARICGIENNDPMVMAPGGAPMPGEVFNAEEPIQQHALGILREVTSASWDYDLTLESLRAPERDRRLEQIETNFGHTFGWVFEDHNIGFADWLRNGSGVYWISGKPGSGKSTLMKFVYNDWRTADLLHNFRSPYRQMTASFFFHHRGSILQKSYEGLLRSLLSQILEQQPELHVLMSDIMDNNLQARLAAGGHGSVESDLRKFFRYNGVNNPSWALQEELTNFLVAASDPAARMNDVFATIFSEMTLPEAMEVKAELLRKMRELLNPRYRSEDQNQLDVIERICERELRWVRSSQLQRLIEEWCYQLDLDLHVPDILHRHGMSGWPRLDEFIAELIRRHRARVELRLAVQREEWSKTALEEGLARVFNQDMFDLEICLFLDALDEYEGPKESVSDFIKDLTQQSPTSRTRAKILFSSRPWSVFQNEFGHCAGFRIHEHTQDDIRQYCIGSMPQDRVSQSLMYPLVEEITRRASGVFLWVKLVMFDLSRLVSQGSYHPEDLHFHLRQALEAVPDELQLYYTAIIDRIPQSQRHATYAILECLSRSANLLELDELPRLLGCAFAKTFDQARHELDNRHNNPDRLDRTLRTITGGLADVVSGGRVQLIHQTCKEWVEDPAFKHIVLGDQARLTSENGHSYLAKYYAILQLTNGRDDTTDTAFLHHAHAAERTTGVSQHRFLTGLPPPFFRAALPRITNDTVSALTLAACNGLYLLLEDELRLNPRALADSTESLFTALFSQTDSLWKDIERSCDFHRTKAVDDHVPPHALEMGRYLLDRGFQVRHDTNGVALLMSLVWAVTDVSAAKKYTDLVAQAVAENPRGDPGMRIPDKSGNLHQKGGDHSSGEPFWTLLHLAPAELAKVLVERGADVNGVNSEGETPLDYVVQPASVHQSLRFGVDYGYRMACLLVRHGGRLSKTEHKVWEKYVAMVEAKGFDKAPLVPLQRTRTRDRVRSLLMVGNRSRTGSGSGELSSGERSKRLTVYTPAR